MLRGAMKAIIRGILMASSEVNKLQYVEMEIGSIYASLKV